ncbi:MAG: M20/M25/M40 family metallo-hydrolase [Polyangiaceae bacterium]|nr:M20/M25/M40 family metallo-hydrolase [Polyangiaceae bacterium]
MLERVLKELVDRKDPMLAEIERLCMVCSYTEHAAGGRIVGDLLAEQCAAIPSLVARRIESAHHHYAPHWIFSTKSAEQSPEGAIAIVGHLDTVFPPGTFEGFRYDGTIARGPGVLDMKGGLVVAIEALRALDRAGVLHDMKVILAVVSDEEVGSPEGRPLLQRELAGASCALVLEAGRKGDAIITSRKGTAGVKAIAHGKAAHAGNARKEGANAIWALAKFVDAAQALTDYERGITVNVGKFTGGQGKNTVPDSAEALLDFRFVTTESGAQTMTKLQEAAEQAACAVAGTRLELTGGIARTPLERTDENVKLYNEYAACALAAGLGNGESALVGGGSDASSTSAIGIPSIDGLGPRGSGFHTKEELIEVATLVPKAEAIARFIVGRATKHTAN